MEHTLYFTERSAHTVHFECNLDIAGYIVLELPIAEWKEIGCPREVVWSITPIIAPEQSEKAVAA